MIIYSCFWRSGERARKKFVIVSASGVLFSPRVYVFRLSVGYRSWGLFFHFFFFFIYICYLSDMHFFFFLRGFWYVMWWSSSLQPPAGRNFVKTKKNSHFSTGFKQCRAIVSTYLITFHKQIPEKHARIPDLVFLFIKKTGKKKISQGKMLWSKVV